MAYFQIFCKALQINSLQKDLIKEKVDAIEVSHGKKPKLTIGQKCRHCRIDCCNRIKKCLSIPKTSRFYRFFYKLQHEGSFENYILKSILGFIGGFCLTYFFFMFFVVQLNFKLSTATLMCSIFGSVLMMGLAFSPYIR